MTRILALLLCFAAFATGAQAYGPDGHRMVGAIADRRLANTPTGEKVAQLLDGFTLEKAALIPDEIKGWDKKGADDPNIFHYTSRPRIDEQLRAFWNANPPTHDHNSPVPSHHWFHYTDVPVTGGGKYGDAAAGRNKWDIVQMIPYCIRVLRGEEPEDNPRKITKPIAIILLAHFVGDIHQPLHVGAEFFDEKGQPANPETNKAALPDEGGNTLNFRLTPRPGEQPNRRRLKLHSFWDNDTIVAHLPAFPEEMPKEERRAAMDVARNELVDRLMKQEPKGWRMPEKMDAADYAEAWADEILPLAREARARLRYDKVEPKLEHDGMVAAGLVYEKPADDKVPYRDWSAKVALNEVHKAGWRLADLLEKIVK